MPRDAGPVLWARNDSCAWACAQAARVARTAPRGRTRSGGAVAPTQPPQLLCEVVLPRAARAVRTGPGSASAAFEPVSCSTGAGELAACCGQCAGSRSGQLAASDEQGAHARAARSGSSHAVSRRNWAVRRAEGGRWHSRPELAALANGNRTAISWACGRLWPRTCTFTPRLRRFAHDEPWLGQQAPKRAPGQP